MKIILTIFFTNLVTNSLSSLFFSFVETKNKNQIFRKLVIWQRKKNYAVSHALLERHAEFNRL